MPTKLTVILSNPRGPFHWACQTISAMATDLATKRTFYIHYSSDEIYPDAKSNPIIQHIKPHNCCTAITRLYSDKDFDTFVASIRKKSSDGKEYNCLSHNCADIVNFAINELCPDKLCTDVSFCLYQFLCIPAFIGSLAMSCFPAPPCTCTTPQDVYDKAKWLYTFTRYGSIVNATGNPEHKSAETEKLLERTSVEMVTAPAIPARRP